MQWTAYTNIHTEQIFIQTGRKTHQITICNVIEAIVVKLTLWKRFYFQVPNVQFKHNLLIWTLFYENEAGPYIVMIPTFQCITSPVAEILLVYINIIKGNEDYAILCQIRFIKSRFESLLSHFAKAVVRQNGPFWPLSLKCLNHTKNNPRTALELF